jgi:predicted component of type VI protein secretion system
VLERFSTKGKKGAAHDRQAELQAVIANLNHILNTKKGFGSFLADFGLGDYNAHRARQKIVEAIIKEFEDNIRLYEPRVKLEKIREVDSDQPFRIRFEVRCLFLDAAKPLYIIIDSLRNEVAVEEA